MYKSSIEVLFVNVDEVGNGKDNLFMLMKVLLRFLRYPW